MSNPLSYNFQIILEASQVYIVIFNTDDDTCNEKDTECTSFHPLLGYSLCFYYSDHLLHFPACSYCGIWIKLTYLGFITCWFCYRFLSIFIPILQTPPRNKSTKYLTTMILLPTFAFNFIKLLVMNNYHPEQIIDQVNISLPNICVLEIILMLAYLFIISLV